MKFTTANLQAQVKQVEDRNQFRYPETNIVFELDHKAGVLYAWDVDDKSVNIFKGGDFESVLNGYQIPMDLFKVDFFNKGLILSDSLDNHDLELKGDNL